MKLRSQLRRVCAELLEKRLLMATDVMNDGSASLRDETRISQPVSEPLGLHPDFASEVDDDIRFLHKELGLTGLGQTVAIIDSGIAFDHAALGGGFGPDYRVVGGHDFAEPNSPQPYDDAPGGFHGTHVAGIVGSDDVRYPGLAPSVDFVALRIFDDNGFSRVDWLEDALQWVHDRRETFEHPITTVNISVGVTEEFRANAWAQIDDELEQLHNDGIFVAVAAGNSFNNASPNSLSFPGESRFVVPTASVNEYGQLSGFSQRRDGIIAAPGEDIISTATDYIEDFNGITDDFASSTGTSMASPFMAGAGILVREALELSGRASVTQDDIVDVLVETADTIVDPTTNQSIHRVNLRRAVTSLINRETQPDTSSSTDPNQLVNDLGMVSLSVLSNQDLTTSPTYSIVADRDGWLTVDVENNSETQFSVSDAQGHELTASNQSKSRIDVEVERGNRYTIQLNADTESKITFANLVSYQANRFDAFGTADDDRFLLDLENHNLRFNDLAYTIPSTVEQINIESGDGRNVINIHASRGDDHLILHSDQLVLSSDGIEVSANGFSETSIHSKSGNDSATVFGSDQSDTIDIQSGSTRLQVDGHGSRLYGFETTTIFGEAGSDTVRIQDSTGDDRLFVGPERTHFKTETQTTELFGFERVFATAKNGGADSAEIEDSARIDNLRVKPSSAYLWAPSHFVFARGFPEMSFHAVHGGDDVARLYDSAGNDVFDATIGAASIEGPGYRNHVVGYETVYAFAASGTDRANIRGSDGDDQVAMLSGSTRMTSQNSMISATGFESVTVESDGRGVDQVFLYDSNGDDDLLATPNFARLSGDNFYNLAKGFAQVFAFARFGGADRATLFDSASDDLLTSTDRTVVLQGDGFRNQINDFPMMTANASSGHDEARIEKVSDTDTVRGRGSQAVIERLANTTTVVKFDTIVVDDHDNAPPAMDVSNVDFAFSVG